MSSPSFSASQFLPTINLIKYDKNWGVPLKEAPRPSNAWMLFRQWHARDLKGEAKAQSQVLSVLWSQVTPETKRHFEDLAAQVKELHLERFPGYAYKPKPKPNPGRTKDERKENMRPYPSKSGLRRPKRIECAESPVVGPSVWLGAMECKTEGRFPCSISTSPPVNDVLVGSANGTVALPTSSSYALTDITDQPSDNSTMGLTPTSPSPTNVPNDDASLAKANYSGDENQGISTGFAEPETEQHQIDDLFTFNIDDWLTFEN